jgi:hypothetical protein
MLIRYFSGDYLSVILPQMFANQQIKVVKDLLIQMTLLSHRGYEYFLLKEYSLL